MRNVRVVHWGFGAMGSGIARVLCGRRGVEITGVCDTRQDCVGRSLYEVLGLPREGRPEARVTGRIEEALAPGSCDACVIATDSFLEGIFPKVVFAAERGANVLTIAEEMAFPRARSPKLAEEMDRVAKANGVTVLGTGINPGLMMDLLAVCLTGCMTRVEGVECRRVNSLSPFGEAVMREQGIGLSPEDFDRGMRDGTLAGHVGFRESVAMIAQALGWELEEFRQQMRPIITEVDRRSPHGFAPAGTVAGVGMTGQGVVGGEEKIRMDHPQQIEPGLAGVETGDSITLRGAPNVNLCIRPEVDGGLGTIAIAANMLPFVVAAAPGLKTMLDLPVPRAVLGDYRLIAFGEV